MKKNILGLITLSSVYAFAGDSCRFDVWWIPHNDHGAVRSAKITFKNVFSEERCREEAKLGQSSEYIIRVTEPGAHIVKTKYIFKSDESKASGTFRHGVWK